MKIAATMLLTMAVLCGAATPVWAVYSYNGSGGSDTIHFGCRFGQAVICDDGTMTVVENDCSLNADVAIYAGSGNDTVIIVRSTANPTCNGSAATLTEVSYGGRFVDVYGEDGDDVLSGGSSDHDLSGGGGADAVTVSSHLGRASGDAGDDTVLAQTSVAGWEVSGGSYADCVSGPNGGDPGTMPDLFDCGTETDEYVDVSGYNETTCETVVTSC